MIPALVVLLALSADPASSAEEPAAPAPLATPTPAETLRYPLGSLPVPDFDAPGDPFTLSDLRYSFDGPVDGDTLHSFAARVRFKDWGYLGAESSGDRRGLTVMTHRLSLSAFDERGRWELGGELRTSRAVFGGSATWRGSSDKSWVLEPTLALRPLRDVEVEAWAVSDTSRPGERSLTELGADASWQYGARLSAFAELTRNYELIATGDEKRSDSGRLSVVAQLGPAELTTEAGLEDVTGRFPRRNTDALLRARAPLAERLLLEAGVHNRYDNGSGELSHDYDVSVTWFGRRITLPRARESARQAVALSRHASARGEYELSAFDPDAQREQRQRLSLSPKREEFRDEMAALYRAEVEERALPLLGLGYREAKDGLSDETVRTLRVLVGVPWPPALPWRARESSVRFLELSYEHGWHTTAPAVLPWHTGSDALTLAIALNRELDLQGTWSRSEPTALDVVRGLATRERHRVSLVYARGR